MTDGEIRSVIDSALNFCMGPGEAFEVEEFAPGIWKLTAFDEVRGTEASRMISEDALASAQAPRELAGFEGAALFRSLREGIAT